MNTLDRVISTMEKYKGSARYYKTNLGYAMVAAELEDLGCKNVDWLITVLRCGAKGTGKE